MNIETNILLCLLIGTHDVHGIVIATGHYLLFEPAVCTGPSHLRELLTQLKDFPFLGPGTHVSGVTQSQSHQAGTVHEQLKAIVLLLE